jgi:membrane-associated phospholipid phosphatase
VNVPNARFDKMSAPPAGEGVRADALVQRLARNIVTNFALWLGALVRPARPLGRGQARPLIAWSVILAVASAASMVLLDARATGLAAAEPHWVRGAFEKITDFGLSGWFLFPCGLILLFLAAVNSRRLPALAQGVLAALTARFGFLFLAVALPGLFVSIVKRLIGRARPYVGGHDDPFAYVPFSWRPEFASMPSGHATTAVAAAIAIGAIWPRTRIVMWIYAATIMVSRVAVLAHHPSDVFAGAVVALVGTHWLRRWFAARRLVFRPSDLRAFRGPSVWRIKAALRQALSAAALSG